MTDPVGGPPEATRYALTTRRLAYLALLLVFLAGAGTGFAGGSRFNARGGRGGRAPRDGMLLDGGPADRYGLSAAQRARIDSVLESRRGEIDAFWRGPGLALRTILDSTRNDVRAVLTPEQRARFDSAHAEHERRFRGRFGSGSGGLRGGGPGGSGPGGPPSMGGGPPGP